MNTTLLPEILRNEIIDNQINNRQQKYRKKNNINNEDNDKLIAKAVVHTDFLSSIESCSENTHDMNDHINEKNGNFNCKINANKINGVNDCILTENPMELFKACFNNYLSFIESLSDVFSPVLTADQVCFLFFFNILYIYTYTYVYLFIQAHIYFYVYVYIHAYIHIYISEKIHTNNLCKK
jgi:hypothetical protein